MFKRLRESDFEPIISAPVPVTAFSIKDDKKVDVLISLQGTIRTSITNGIERAYKAAFWSVGILLTIAGAWILHGHGISLKERILFVAGTFLFGFLTQLHLDEERKEYFGNGVALVKVEAALGLCQSGAYIQDVPFFGYSGKWVPARSLVLLQIFHGVVLLLVLAALIFIDPLHGASGVVV